MPADKQLFATASQSKAGSPRSSAKQLKLAGSQHGPDCPVAAAANQELAAHDGHDSHVQSNTAKVGHACDQRPAQGVAMTAAGMPSSSWPLNHSNELPGGLHAFTGTAVCRHAALSVGH